MKVLIVEDETAASENLTGMLMELDSSIEILAVKESVQQTVSWLNANAEPDLIFMDIHLSDASAFSIFDQIEVKTPIIFTTAYDEYAIDAFRVNSIDYLLKPVQMNDLRRALKKFMMLNKIDVIEYLQRMMSLNPKTEHKEYKKSLLVPHKDKLIPIDLTDVACIHSTDRNTQLFLKDGRVMQYNKSLDQIMLGLNPSEFVRANKQYIVAKSVIKELVVWFDSRLLVHVGVDIPEPMYISKNKAAEFKNWLTGK